MKEMPLDAAHQKFAELANNIVGKQSVYTDYFYRFAYGTDASLYRYVPQVVVRAQREIEVIALIKAATECKVALTFRASGTSLSGQTSSQSVLVLLGHEFLNLQIQAQGEKVTVGPMVIGASVNKALKPYNRKIGPDPASISVARIGGIVSNNSSGMCCGTKNNSYHTLQDIRLILNDGTILDTRDAENVASFRKSHAGFLQELTELRERIIANPVLKEKVAVKYRLKNTTGYGVNALIDFEDPVEILKHLIVGSEGTLGFVSEVVYQTVPEYDHKASAFIYFTSLAECCETVKALRKEAPVEAVELFDGRTLHLVGEAISHLPAFFYRPLNRDSACLLIETMGETAAELQAKIAQIESVYHRFNIVEETGFQTDPVITKSYWDTRKGLLPIVAKGRKSGASIIPEDVVFPMEHLVEGVQALTDLFDKHKFPEATIMGHALEGNLHFLLAPDMTSKKKIKQFDQFMDELAEVVAVKYGGSLKGEHGTGRNIAPFVEAEWGSEIYQVMRDIKALFDPHKIFNPDVIITDNKALHITSFKTIPVADKQIHDCIECGFCEPACPSDGLSLTPRQRIAVYRNMQALPRTGESGKLFAKLNNAYQYAGIETCAETGMCSLRCPVGINTGEFIKSIRPMNSKALVRIAGNRFNLVEKSMRFAVNTAHKVGMNRVHQLTGSMHKAFKGIPVMPQAMPEIATNLPSVPVPSKIENSVVYFSTCVNRNLQEIKGAQDLQDQAPKNTFDHVLSLLHKAGFTPFFPDKLSGACCGQPFVSAKAPAEAELTAKNLNDILLKASRYGEIPIYVDNAPCALQVHDLKKRGLLDDRLMLYHSAEFLLKEVVPRLTMKTKIEKLLLHTPCSVAKDGGAEMLQKLAESCAHQVESTNIECCGFGGAKGFSVPEINANSLKRLPKDTGQRYDIGASMSKTCQLGLTTHTGLQFKSIEALLDECAL